MQHSGATYDERKYDLCNYDPCEEPLTHVWYDSKRYIVNYIHLSSAVF